MKMAQLYSQNWTSPNSSSLWQIDTDHHLNICSIVLQALKDQRLLIHKSINKVT